MSTYICHYCLLLLLLLLDYILLSALIALVGFYEVPGHGRDGGDGRKTRVIGSCSFDSTSPSSNGVSCFRAHVIIIISSLHSTHPTSRTP